MSQPYDGMLKGDNGSTIELCRTLNDLCANNVINFHVWYHVSEACLEQSYSKFRLVVSENAESKALKIVGYDL